MMVLKMKNRLKKMVEKLEIPMGIMSGYFVEIYSGNEIVLSGDAAVVDLSDSVLKIKCGKDFITFYGKNIKIEYYLSTGIKISGEFSSIEFG